MRLLPRHLIVAAVVWSTLRAPAAGAAAAPETIAELQREIEAVLKRPRSLTPGAAIAIVRRDGPEWVAGVGLADVTTRRPATADTLFRIGSTSKGLVALSILKLQEEGKLRLDDTLKSRAPDLPFANPWEATDPVRLVHLLEHTTGWDDCAPREYAFDPPQEVSLREELDLRPETRTSRWKPGTRYSYCYAGPAVAAYVVEKITGQRFEDYVQDNWFRPLGMTTASYFGTPDVLSRLTQRYRGDGVTPYPYWKIHLRPSGSINASARDMANYVQFYVNEGAFGGVQLLSRESLARMQKPTSTYAAREGLEGGYGPASFTLMRGRRLAHGHPGGVMGGLTYMAYIPELGVGYCIMINSGQQLVLRDLDRLIWTYVMRGAAAPVTPAVQRVPASMANDYDGWYEPITPRNELVRFLERLMGLTRVTVGDTDLTFRGTNGRRSTWVAAGARTFRLANGPLPSLALIADRSEGTLIQIGGGPTFRRLPTGEAEIQIATCVVIALLGAASLLFGLVWVPRRVFGDFRGDGHLRVRTLPLLATLCGVALIAAAWPAGADVIHRFGRMTPWSLALFVLSIAFPVLALWGLDAAVKARNAAMGRLVWWHSFLTSAAMTIAAAYLAYWGIVGVRTWA